MNEIAERESDGIVVEGVVIDEMTEAEAREHTDGIKSLLTRGLGIWDEAADWLDVAWQRQTWRKLHYESWDAFCHEEFGGLRTARLEATQRKELVAQLTQSRMSSRAVAAVLNVNPSTVQRDRKEAVEQDAASAAANEAAASPVPTQMVRGLDGRDHPIRPKAVRRRPPLSDALRNALSELGKDLKMIENVLNDDRWPGAAADLSQTFIAGYMQAAERLENIIERMASARPND